jgi:hypothetical protein
VGIYRENVGGRIEGGEKKVEDGKSRMGEVGSRGGGIVGDTSSALRGVLETRAPF